MNNLVKSVIALTVSSILYTQANAATYQVVEVGDSPNHKYSFGKQTNVQGDTVVSAASRFNLPIQFSYLSDTDFDNIKTLAANQNEFSTLLVDLQDFEALKAGNPTANDLAWAIQYLQDSTRSASLFYQKFSDTTVMLNQAGQLSEIRIFDQPLDDGRLTRSTQEYVNGITDDGWIFGNASAPYLPLNFTNSSGTELTYWLREFTTRGFVVTNNGQTVHQIIPPEATYGGESAILGMNDNLEGVGYVSTKINSSAQATIEDETGGCADPDILDDTPFDACISNLKSNLYDLSAAKFQFDTDGNLVSTELFDNFVTPNADDTKVYKNYAQAINNNGVAVGFAHGWVDETVTEPSTSQARNFYAVVYKNGEVIDITPDHSTEYDSRLYDINNNGIAVGHVTKSVNGFTRTKFFILDTNETLMEKQFVDDFFTGSSSKAYAINDAGFVVGSGEVETQNDQQTSTGSSNPRRTHGFLYDIAQDKFADLNDFLSCDSPYTIIEARGITENNEITATAIIKVNRRDAKGETVLDEDGNPLTEDVARAVVLKPTAGEIEDCSTVEDKVERKGAGFGWVLMSLLSLVSISRRKKYT